jgi:hypothetical protein
MSLGWLLPVAAPPMAAVPVASVPEASAPAFLCFEIDIDVFV